jgi:transposase
MRACRKDHGTPYVKPFVRRQKNDSDDAEAICTGLQQPTMRFVPKKTLDQQDVQALHRARQKLINYRTALISQMRGLLLDRGIAIGVAATRARRLIPQILAEPNDELTGLMREIIASLYAFMLQIDERIRASIKRSSHLQSERSLPADCQNQRRRPEDRDCHDCRNRGWK